MTKTKTDIIEYVNIREIHKKYLQYLFLTLAFGIFAVSVGDFTTKTDPIQALVQEQKNNLDTVAKKRKQEGQILQKMQQLKKELEAVQKDIATLEGDNVNISDQIITLTHPTYE